MHGLSTRRTTVGPRWRVGAGASEARGDERAPGRRRCDLAERRATAVTALLVLSLGGCVVTPALEGPRYGPAQPPPEDARRWNGAVGLALDNDIFAATDKHYTNGVRLGVLLPPTRALRDRAAAVGRAVDWGVVVGQQIFTPEDLEAHEPIEDDRPYAGWLYTGIVLRLRGGDPWDLPGGRPVLDTFELDIGVVGPWSLAETTQRFVHEALGGDEPGGWDHQVRQGPGLQVSWLRQVRLLRAWLPLGLELDLTPHVGAAAGTVQIQARAGATLRVGWNLPTDFGGLEDDALALPLPLGPRPRDPPGIGAWIVARVDARASLLDVLLENSPFHDDGPRVRREPLVGSVEVGFMLSFYERVMIGYTHTVRSPEFRGQGGPDAHGSVFLQVAF